MLKHSWQGIPILSYYPYPLQILYMSADFYTELRTYGGSKFRDLPTPAKTVVDLAVTLSDCIWSHQKVTSIFKVMTSKWSLIRTHVYITKISLNVTRTLISVFSTQMTRAVK